MGACIAKYLADRITQLQLKYSEVVKKFPNEKENIDEILTENNMQHLIKENE